MNVGGLRLRALATPGHTPEHLAYLLLDGQRPLALFSGGSLLVGAVARTDLSGDDRTEELARALWRSLHERVLTLPDELPVYPTHGSGSFCSSPAGAGRATTIGQEKASNPLLGADGEDAFVRLLLDSLGTYPRYFLRLPELNRTGPRVYGPQPPSLEPLSAEEVRRLLGEGAWLIDARPIASFGREHIPGAISIQLRDDFATWLGWLVPDDVPLVFLLDPGQNRVDLVRQALKIGYEHLAGELAGGTSAWRTAGFPTASVPFVLSEGVQGPEVLDIRQTSEFVEGHIPGSHHIELGSLTNGEPGPLPPPGLVLTCGHGERAMSGASLLKRAGRRNVAVLEGGTSAWARAGRPVETG
jgi:rhodanese-related sulfurtransferase